MESFIDRRYRLLLFQCCAKNPVFTGSPTNPKWKLECPLCGASGASLVWMPSKSTFKFLCPASRRQNCGVHAEFLILLKMWNVRLFAQYLQQREEEGSTGPGFNCPRLADAFPQGVPRAPQNPRRGRCISQVDGRSWNCSSDTPGDPEHLPQSQSRASSVQWSQDQCARSFSDQ